MRCAAVICEFNPFHNGHERILSAARENGADYVIALMSGDFVQRGEPAALERHARAKMALLSGADAVLALPTRFASSSAESFASSAVRILEGLGVVDELVFGSESGRLEELYACARELSDESRVFREHLADGLKEGMSFAKARAEALPHYRELLSYPNNILGTEYLKALIKMKSAISPVTVKRKGGGYDSLELSELPSAAALRTYALEGKELEPLSACMPEMVYSIFKMQAETYGLMTADHLSGAAAAALLEAAKNGNLTDYEDVTDSLSGTIRRELPYFTSFEQFADRCKSRSVTRTHLMRAVLHVALGIRKNDPGASGLFTQVLGFRKEASALVGRIMSCSKVPVVMNPPSDRGRLTGADRALFDEEMRVSDFYRLIRAVSSGIPGGAELAEEIVKV